MSTVQIFYINSTGESEITTSVLFARTWFESQLGAQPGQFEMVLKDPDQVLSFVAGNRVRLEIDSQKMYGGYVFQVVKGFAFAVGDTITNGPEGVKIRLWTLRGVDYNILFDKRFIFNVADPTKRIEPTSLTTDSAILALMVGSYLDLSSDDIDTTTHVMTVGDPAPQGEYDFANVGIPWRKQMGSLVAKTGAIFYLAPGTGSAEIDLYLRGREVSTPGWGFSDTPDGVTTFGFREAEVIEDASNLVNDGLVWAGNQYGPTGVTGELLFGRSQDTDSINDLFRSQRAEPHFGDKAYVTQADTQGRANVIVYGRPDGDPQPGATGEDSADPARGLREPQRFLRLSWFDSTVPTTLIPGSVVSVYLNSFTKNYTLPVRNIRIRFESPTIVRYDGYLGVQTDDPFTLWKYMADVAAAGGTGAVEGTTFVTPTSDGSSVASVGGTYVCMVPSGTPNGTTTVFLLRDAYQPGSVKVWMNGLLQRPFIEYTESNPVAREVTFYDPPLTGDQLWICYTSA